MVQELFKQTIWVSVPGFSLILQLVSTQANVPPPYEAAAYEVLQARQCTAMPGPAHDMWVALKTKRQRIDIRQNVGPQMLPL